MDSPALDRRDQVESTYNYLTAQMVGLPAGLRAFSATLQLIIDQLHVAASFCSQVTPDLDRSIIIGAGGDLDHCGLILGGEERLGAEFPRHLPTGAEHVIALENVDAAPEVARWLPHVFTGGGRYMAAPIVLSDGTLFGLLGAIDPQPGPFSSPQEALMATLARLVAAQVEYDRELTERRRAEEALRYATEMHRSFIEGSRDAIFTIAPDGTIIALNPAFEAITGWSAAAWIGKPFSSLIHPDDVSSAEKLFRGVLSGDSPALQLRALTRADQHWFAEITASPHAPHGVLTAVFGIVRDVTERKLAELDLQQTNRYLTHSVATLEERTRQMGMLNDLGDLLHTCVTVAEAYAVVAQFTPQLFPGQAGALTLLNAESQLVEVVASWGISASMQRLFGRDDCWALRRGRVHLVTDRRSGLLCRHLGHPPPAGYMCVPMMAQGEALGMLYVECDDSQLDSFEQQEPLALSLAEHISLALANLRLRETLQSMAIRDPLTGLFNRRYLEESLERELRRTARNGQPIGVIMLDVDHFKRFNDTFGHLAGDAMLNSMASLFRKRTRAGDIASRYGGEEFTLVLPEASLEHTRIRAEQIRQEVKLLQVQHQSRPLGPVTLSLGVASFPEHGTTAATLLEAADAALYHAKNGGRDRVVVAQPE